MIQPLVLMQCDPDDVEHARRMLDALKEAASWRCDRRSQIPTLRFVGPDETERIVAMEGAQIDPSNPESRRDGHPSIADALRDAALLCLRRALLPVDAGVVDEARERRAAYDLLVAAELEVPEESSCIVTASTPWRPAYVQTFDVVEGMLTAMPGIEAPHADLCPVMYCVSEGDSGSMRDLSIGLYVCQEMRQGGIVPFEALRAGALLQKPWRNA